jgi:predicted SpoU family rRNA methylase
VFDYILLIFIIVHNITGTSHLKVSVTHVWNSVVEALTIVYEKLSGGTLALCKSVIGKMDLIPETRNKRISSSQVRT